MLLELLVQLAQTVETPGSMEFPLQWQLCRQRVEPGVHREAREQEALVGWQPMELGQSSTTVVLVETVVVLDPAEVEVVRADLPATEGMVGMADRQALLAVEVGEQAQPLEQAATAVVQADLAVDKGAMPL